MTPNRAATTPAAIACVLQRACPLPLRSLLAPEPLANSEGAEFRETVCERPLAGLLFHSRPKHALFALSRAH